MAILETICRQCVRVTLVIIICGLACKLSAAEKLAKHWKLEDFEDARSLICAWEEGKGQIAVRACEALGFEVVDATADDGVVCKWKGPLDAASLAKLVKEPAVRYVEPNSIFSIKPEFGAAKFDAKIEFTPVYTPDKVLQELQDTKELICAWKEGKGKEAVRACEALGFEIVDTTADDGVVCTWKGDLIQETIDKLAANVAVKYIEPNSKISAQRANAKQLARKSPTNRVADARLPQDEFVKDMYAIRNINAPLAWRAVQGSDDVVVAVCDSGVDYTHDDLQDNMWSNPKTDAPDKRGADFVTSTVAKDSNGRAKFDAKGKLIKIVSYDPMDRHYHGTHVAGTIGAVGNNGEGTTGICWRVRIMPIRCLNEEGNGALSGVVKAIDYAIENGASVINLSLGTRSGPHQEFIDIIKKAREKGVILVCSAGNKTDGEADNDKKESFPASYTRYKAGNVPLDNIIVVANTDIEDKLNDGSHFGQKSVHLAAPGTDILSTLPMKRTKGYDLDAPADFPTKYGRLSGTSMSAPHVSGAVALMLSHPKYRGPSKKSASEIKNVLLGAVKRLDQLEGRLISSGLLDISFLEEGAEPPTIPADPPAPIVICPRKPPCVIVCPPLNTCPQYRNRIYPPCRRR